MSALIPLAAPVPPMLEQALGYDHEHPTTWVSFYWEPAGDELLYDDGRRSGDGEWHAWLLYIHHRVVAPHLVRYDLGSSDAPARHRLVLDRRARRLYAAPAREAAATCFAQWPVEPLPDPLTPEQARRLSEVYTQRVREGLVRDDAAIMAEVERRMAAQHRLEGELAAWLDAHAAPTEGT
jgi:hypothetical protein